MELSGTLQNKIIEFLKSLPNLDDKSGRQAFIYSTGLDSQLKDQISFDEPPAQFVPLLVSQLLKYGMLNNGRYALESVLQEAKNYIGQDKKEYCETLLQEFFANRNEQSEPKTNKRKTTDDTEEEFERRNQALDVARKRFALVQTKGRGRRGKQDH